MNCPIKDMAFKDCDKPWITQDILESIHERNEYMSEYCQGRRRDPDLLEKAKQVEEKGKHAVFRARITAQH